MSKPLPPLPIDAVLAELRAALAARPAAVLQAPPGAGKTTRVPLALLDAAWLRGRRILILEPRRLAAKAACARMAEELGETVGGTVGYRIRFENRVSARTRIEVLTEGILTRRLQQDPLLEGVGLVIFDEYHERSLHADLALALCLDSQRGLREDLKLLVMSATLDGAAVAHLLDDAPLIASAGRCYPVSVHYLPPPAEARIPDSVADSVRKLLPDTAGSILAFLPGGGEIRRAQEALEAAGLPENVRVYPLYGDLPKEIQEAAIRPAAPGQRKLVLATPIAETSLTIEGIDTVIDSGWHKRPRFDPRSGLGRLDTLRVSQASAEQRAGRAGRLGPGTCYRLWSAEQQARLAAHTAPEIIDADLAPVALELALWGVADPAQLAWLDPPPPGALAQARDVLLALDALDAQGHITALGRAMAAWPVHPRLAHLLCRADELGWRDLGCDTAALLAERDILRGPGRGADLGLRLRALRAFRASGRRGAREFGADAQACAQVDKIAGELRRRFRDRPDAPGLPPQDQEYALGVLLAFAYPDRIAARRGADYGRYRLSGGRGAVLAEGDGLGREDCLVVADLDAGGREARIYLAAPVRRADLLEYLADKIEAREQVAWDEGQACVLARREWRLGGLVLDSAALSDVDPALRLQALLDGVRRAGLDALPWDPAARAWQARVLCLREWFPEEGWPDLGDVRLLDTLETWLGPYLGGMGRLGHLQQLKLLDILRDQLDWAMRQRLEQEAPTHITVPSGSRIAVQYVPGQPPVLAVRLQEMFGLADTPSVGRGRIKLVLHLLSPAQRPIQVTQDLRGFWERTYAEVKKELKGRYPKHYWPDDPWSATATRRARPR